MTRPTAEELERALSFVRDTEYFDKGDPTEDFYGILAAEVLALREDKERLIRGAPAIENAEIAHLKATIARVAALPAEWRAYADRLRRLPNDEIIARVRKGCANELDAALRGES